MRLTHLWAPYCCSSLMQSVEESVTLSLFPFVPFRFSDSTERAMMMSGNRRCVGRERDGDSKVRLSGDFAF